MATGEQGDPLATLASAANQVPTWVVVIALVFVQSSFGAYGPLLTKLAQHAHTNPLVFCVFRDSFAFPCLLLAARISEGTATRLGSFKRLPQCIFAVMTGV